MTVLPLTKAQAKFPLPKQAPIRLCRCKRHRIQQSGSAGSSRTVSGYAYHNKHDSRLIYNDDTANTFDLSNLDVDARDQYGEDMFLYENNCIWKLASNQRVAEIDENDGTTITGLVVGTGYSYLILSQSEQTMTAKQSIKPLSPLQLR